MSVTSDYDGADFIRLEGEESQATTVAFIAK